jgi:hypothetical protein
MAASSTCVCVYVSTCRFRRQEPSTHLLLALQLRVVPNLGQSLVQRHGGQLSRGGCTGNALGTQRIQELFQLYR